MDFVSVPCVSSEWQLFYHTEISPSLPVAHSLHLKENYESVMWIYIKPPSGLARRTEFLLATQANLYHKLHINISSTNFV